jgi:hypothetical protein
VVDGVVEGVWVHAGAPAEAGEVRAAGRVAEVSWALMDGITSPPMRTNVSSQARATPPTRPTLPITAPRYLNKSPTQK